MNVVPGRAERRHLDRVPVRHARGQVARRRRGRLRRRGDARVRPRHVAVVASPTGRGGRGPRPVGRGLSAVPRRDGSARPVRREPASRRAEVRPAVRARRARAGVLLVEDREGTRRRRPHGGAAARPGGPRRATRTAARVRSRALGTSSHATRTPGASSSSVDHPALGLCLDSFHVLSLDNDPAVIAQIAGDKVFHVQLADAPRLNMDVREWSLHYRMFPGQGSLDVAGFLSRILAMGYAGPIALEVFNDVYQQEDPRHAATDAMRSMLALAEAVAARGSGGDPELFSHGDLPPAPAARRFRVRRARRGRGVGSPRLTRPRRPRVRPCRAASLQAGAAVGAGRRSGPAQPRPGAIDRPRHRIDLRARGRERRPDRLDATGGAAAGARSSRDVAAPTRPT